ncbi:MAG: DUF4115 domain-containing protein [Rhodoferax sp.]|nr:DUF4115 domain-containing protein [Rhodoferax sp.]
MNDMAAADLSTAATACAPASPGAMLRAAREAQGLHIGALAVMLKVPVKKIEALEADCFQELPDMVFVRSLAMSVCRSLKINPEPVLALLPALSDKTLKPMDGGLNTHFRDATLAVQGSWRNQLRSPIGLGALALLVATALVLFWRAPATDATDQPAAVTVPAPLAATSPTSTTAPPSAPTAAAATTIIDAPGVVPVVSTATDVNPGTTPAPELAVLEFVTRGVSWIEVTDADGALRIRKFTVAGEVLPIAGKLPLSVILGRADQLDVRVRGQVLDLTPWVRDNVARFEVK